MEDTVFPSVSHGQDYGWQALEFFNSLCSQNSFFWGLCLLVNKTGCVVNDDYCIFPDMASDDLDDHFDGVLFGIGDSEVIVSEEFFFRVLKEACVNYLALDRNDGQDVIEIMNSKLCFVELGKEDVRSSAPE